MRTELILNISRAGLSVLFSKNRKSILQMAQELIHVRKKHKCCAYYFTNFAYGKDCDVDNYVSNLGYRRFIANDYVYNETLTDKLIFQEFTQEHKFQTPKYLGRIKDRQLITDLGQSELSNREDTLNVLSKLLKNRSDFFIKHAFGARGQNVFKVNADNLVNVVNKLIAAEDETFILQESLIQHNRLNSINPSSINTLRVVTYKESGKEPIIASCLLRMGTGTSHVDNGAAGGIFTHYDIKKNKLGPIAYREVQKGGGIFTQHPTTGFVFEGKELPYPDKVKELVLNLAEKTDSKIVAWDIGYTPEGPAVIEGNFDGDIQMVQIVEKGLKTNPVYRKLFSGY